MMANKGALSVFEVLEPGVLTTIQDLGRFGCQKYGVPLSGAMDDFSLKVANLLVGNDSNAAALEITGLGPKLKVLNDTVLSLSGADFNAALDESPFRGWRSVRVRKGSIICVKEAGRGFRGYLAAAGGIEVPEVLGSRSTYLTGKMGGLDGRSLRKGDIINSSSLPVSSARIPLRFLPEEYIPVFSSRVEVRVIMGPQDDRFDDEGIKTFLNSWYVVSLNSDRTAYRLTGPKIAHRQKADIITDAIPQGAIQVPGDGQPIVMMADRPTTGGYAKIACVIAPDIPRIAQLKPQDEVRFRKIGIDEAHEFLKDKETELTRIRKVLEAQARVVTRKKYRVRVGDEVYQVLVEEIPDE